MSPHDDQPRDQRPGQDEHADPEAADRSDVSPGVPADEPAPLDEDAAWAEIVANYGDRPAMGPPGAPPADAETPRRNVFDSSYLDAGSPGELDTPASWGDEGHFVPPEPPPLPPSDPRRTIAWGGVLGAPALLLVLVFARTLLGWETPTWLTGLLVVGFVGGFGYLVATMPRRDDDWPGDDGAVV